MEGENHGEMETIGEVVYTFLGLGIRQVIPIIICFFFMWEENRGEMERIMRSTLSIFLGLAIG